MIYGSLYVYHKKTRTIDNIEICIVRLHQIIKIQIIKNHGQLLIFGGRFRDLDIYILILVMVENLLNNKGISIRQ